jgi:hypothetical protein
MAGDEEILQQWPNDISAGRVRRVDTHSRKYSPLGLLEAPYQEILNTVVGNGRS